MKRKIRYWICIDASSHCWHPFSNDIFGLLKCKPNSPYSTTLNLVNAKWWIQPFYYQQLYLWNSPCLLKRENCKIAGYICLPLNVFPLSHSVLFPVAAMNLQWHEIIDLIVYCLSHSFPPIITFESLYVVLKSVRYSIIDMWMAFILSYFLLNTVQLSH